MGLYSTIYSSFDRLGHDSIGEFQTKDLESLMEEYWLSPMGELFFLNYSGCFEAFVNDYPKNFLDHIRYEATGNHAKMEPCSYNGVLTMYTGRNGDWVEFDLYFQNGIVSLVLDERNTPSKRERSA
jgi:hypothetical protein